MSDTLESTTYERLLRVAAPDPESGTFKMTLATEGEASDGHVLSIEGGEIPERMPLLVSHMNDPKEAVGSITHARKHLTTSPPRITALGAVELDGDGPSASIRRDLMHMVARGHVNAVSIRWDFDPKHAIRRAELPKDHPHHVKEDGPKRYGIYFKRWRALEGSIVALGADPLALIARSDESEEPLRSFWRSFAADAEPKQPESPKAPDPASLRAAFAAQVREMIAQGIDLDALAAEIESARPAEVPDTAALLARIAALEQKLESVEGRVLGEPTPPRMIESLRNALEGIRQDRLAALAEAEERLKKMQGRVA